jgi:acetoin utilization deacetylase AcuC-like enzyme
MNKTGFLYDPYFLRHDTGASHYEHPERLLAILEGLDDNNLSQCLTKLTPEPVPFEALTRVHEPAYVDLIRMACEEGMGFLGAERTRIGRESFEVARRAAGAVLTACDAVMEGQVDGAFCLVRPPGHHAGRDQVMGFCLFNNVAVGAEHLIGYHGLARVAIVDWDVHHGNGTQEIFETRSDVLFISIHEWPGYSYPGTGHETETGRGAGQGATLNIPMRPGSGDADYRAAFEAKVLPALEAFRPEFILISAGFDGAAEERVASILLAPDSFGWMTHALNGIARQCGHRRIVSVLEGGYDLPSLQRCTAAHVRALLADGDEPAALSGH